MADNSIFMRVDEVAKILDVSESYAYKIMKQLKLFILGLITKLME